MFATPLKLAPALLLTCGLLAACAADEEPAYVIDPRAESPLPASALVRLGTSRFRHPFNVRGLAFSPDGKVIASGSQKFTIRLWDAETGRELKMLTGHTAGVTGLAFSPDGKTLASASLDKTIRMWKLNGTEKAEEQGKGTDRSHELLRLSTGEKVIVTKQYADWLHQLSSLLEKLKLSAMARGR